jgi:hypothetical protein
MLLWKVGTARCEASRDSEMGGRHGGSRFWKPCAGRLVPEGLFGKTGRLAASSCGSRKRAVLLPGRLKVLAWNLIPQRPCTAVTLFAAIPCQDRQQAVDLSVTSATHWRHFQAPTGSPHVHISFIQDGHVVQPYSCRHCLLPLPSLMYNQLRDGSAAAGVLKCDQPGRSCELRGA